MAEVADPPPTERPAESPAGQAPAEKRGALVIRDKVVEEVARQAALSVPGVVAGRTGTLDKLIGQATPRIETTVAAGRVRAVVHIAVQWPQPLATVAAAVRDTVREQLSQVTGLTIDAVDVRVDSDLDVRPDTTRRVQ